MDKFTWKINNKVVEFSIAPEFGINTTQDSDYGIIEYIDPNSESNIKNRIEITFNTNQRSKVIDVFYTTIKYDGNTPIAGTSTSQSRYTTIAEYNIFRSLQTGTLSIGYIANRAMINNQLQNMEWLFGEELNCYKNTGGFKFFRPIQVTYISNSSGTIEVQQANENNELLYLDALGEVTTEATRVEDIPELMLTGQEGEETTQIVNNTPLMETIDAENGSITINVENEVTENTYEYSIDNGNNYQSSPIFNNLSSGIYNIVVRCIEETQEIGQDILSNSKTVTI